MIQLAIILAGCSQPAGSSIGSLQPDSAIILENEGYICFEEYENSLEVRGFFIPKGCFSSTCTRPIQQDIGIQVDTTNMQFRFDTRFVLIDPYAASGKPGGSYECSADCDGAGRIQFEIGDVDRGTYTIWLGERNWAKSVFHLLSY